MPQMSPMNWIIISTFIPIMIIFMKTIMNENFMSKMNKNKKIKKNSYNLLW